MARRAPKDQPPTHYRLLGIDLFESDPDVIATAADQRMAHVKGFQSGQNAALSQRILNELAAAKVCLLNAGKKAEYDKTLLPTAPPPAGVAAAPPKKSLVIAQPIAPPPPAPQTAPQTVDTIDDDLSFLHKPVEESPRRHRSGPNCQ